jgi:ligand-binding sensor domain-containing protein
MVFDGETWTNLSKVNGLIDNYVTSIEEDVNGDMWFGTLNGFSIYDGSKFSNYQGTNGNLWTVLSIESSIDGDMWVGTMQHGLHEITSDGILDYSFDTNLAANYVNSIDESQDGTIWAGTRGGILKIKSGNVKFITTRQGLSTDTVNAVYCDSWGDTWIGYYNGLNISRFSGDQFMDVSLFNGGSRQYVNSINEDGAGNIWVGLISGGVVRYDGVSMRTFSYNDGLAGITIMAVEVDLNGCVWFGSFEDGITKYTPLLSNEN